MMIKNLFKLSKLQSNNGRKYISRKLLDTTAIMKKRMIAASCSNFHNSRVSINLKVDRKDSKPLFKLSLNGLAASSFLDIKSPIYFIDVKTFILQCHNIPNVQPFNRWYQLKRPDKLSCNALIVIEGAHETDLSNMENCTEGLKFGNSKKEKLKTIQWSKITFHHIEPVENFAEELYHSYKYCKDENSLNKDVPNYKYEGYRLNSILRKDLQAIIDSKDQFDRRKLLVKASNFRSNGIPIPGANQDEYELLIPCYKKVQSNSPMFSLDCEMVTTQIMKCGAVLKYGVELAKISVVDENLKVIYSTWVKPRTKIISYNTKVNGITMKDLKGVTKRLEDVQKDLAKLLPNDAILIGHSVGCDLRALRLCHPYCIDSSRIFNVNGNQIKLEKVARIFLKTKIHEIRDIHDPTEDASMAMLLVKKKLSKSINYGDYANGWNGQIDDEEILDDKINVLEVLSNTSTLQNVIYSSTLTDNVSKKLSQHINLINEPNNKCIFSKATELLSNKQNVIAHIKIKETHELNKLDEYINTLWSSLPAHSIITVLVPRLTSDNNITNGYCFVSLKTE